MRAESSSFNFELTMEEILSIDVWNEDHEESFLRKNIEKENFKFFCAEFGLNMHILYI